MLGIDGVWNRSQLLASLDIEKLITIRPFTIPQHFTYFQAILSSRSIFQKKRHHQGTALQFMKFRNDI